MTRNSTFALSTSRYNFFLPTDDAVILFNASSGMIMDFSGEDAEKLVRILCLPNKEIAIDSLDPELLKQLEMGGFLIPTDFDELEAIHNRFQRVRKESPIILTLTVTADCNLNCYYCYEKRSEDRLSCDDIPAIVDCTRQRLQNDGKNSLHVAWYGGEPLLNINFIEEASKALQSMCNDMGKSYSSSIISNGTCWPDDVEGFIQRHKIKQVQITFDGLSSNHNKRRRYSSRYINNTPTPFDKTVQLVDRLLEVVHVDIRLNLDPGNVTDAVPFINFIKERGWFNKKYKVVVFPARLSAITEKAKHVGDIELSVERFNKVKAEVAGVLDRSILPSNCGIHEDDLKPKNSVCAALAYDSFVVGADKNIYRCGLQVCESQSSVDCLYDNKVCNEEKKQMESWWARYDPTKNQACSVCSFLPLCWGGCPKMRLEENSALIEEQCNFWLKNLPRLIAKAAGIKYYEGIEYDKSFQFKAAQ